MSIKNLIPKDMWKQLQKDSEDLEKFGYVIKCEDCGKVFLETTLEKIKKEIRQGIWEKPQIWYVQAALHWVESDFIHKISMFMVYPSGVARNSFMLSSDWKKQRQDRFSPNFNASKTAMLNELKHLATQIKSSI